MASCSKSFLLLSVLFTTVYNAAGRVHQNKLPLVINTWAFKEANEVAWKTLHETTNADAALEALVEGCSTCEKLQCDGTVGFGGSPDENGETTLDAMIMDGATMNIGAVAGLRQIKNVIRVARHVLLHTKHTLLVGDAASDFAEMMGFERESLSTQSSKAMWQKWRSNNCQPNFWIDVIPDPKKSCGPYKPKTYYVSPWEKYKSVRYEYVFGRWNHDTIGMIVIDSKGQIYAGTSTNGARHKIPGRAGDSPIPGAGAYANNDVGAAVATGDGDVMMRFLPSFLAVESLRNGLNPNNAADLALQRILRYHPDFSGGLVVADHLGNYGAACAGMKKFPFSVRNGNATQETRIEYKECIEV